MRRPRSHVAGGPLHDLTHARAAVRRPARPGLDIAAAVLAVVVVVRLTRMQERKVRSDELPTPAHG
ncbi:hypothetical protein ACF1GT_10420 [Streptomyces sp. NPDC014636]|uniref:hypothetical protein n=1 Tax=Streptomyces sp. NPDC014636 TaxID=3364876 RepID=UPI003702C58E